MTGWLKYAVEVHALYEEMIDEYRNIRLVEELTF